MNDVAANREPARALAAFARRHDIELGEVVLAGAHVMFLALILAAWSRGMALAPRLLGVNVAIAALTIMVRRVLVRAPGGPLWILRHWYPVLFYPLFFTETGFLVPALNSAFYDQALIRADRALFGVDPTVWLDRLAWPWLVEILMICYVSYYILPVIVGAQALRHRGVAAYQTELAAISLAFYVSYLCYFFVPAIGPRFTVDHPRELSGLLTFGPIHNFLLNAEGRMPDCFPSGHTAITLIAVWYAWRHHRPTFWGVLPAATGLVVSTVFLRYHYVIDLIAALPLFVGAVLAIEWIFPRWARFRGATSSQGASYGRASPAP